MKMESVFIHNAWCDVSWLLIPSKCFIWFSWLSSSADTRQRDRNSWNSNPPACLCKLLPVLLNSLLFLVQPVERPKTQTIQLVWERVCVSVTMCLYERDGRGKEANSFYSAFCYFAICYYLEMLLILCFTICRLRVIVSMLLHLVLHARMQYIYSGPVLEVMHYR